MFFAIILAVKVRCRDGEVLAGAFDLVARRYSTVNEQYIRIEFEPATPNYFLSNP